MVRLITLRRERIRRHGNFSTVDCSISYIRLLGNFTVNDRHGHRYGWSQYIKFANDLKVDADSMFQRGAATPRLAFVRLEYRIFLSERSDMLTPTLFLDSKP